MGSTILLKHSKMRKKSEPDAHFDRKMVRIATLITSSVVGAKRFYTSVIIVIHKKERSSHLPYLLPMNTGMP